MPSEPLLFQFLSIVSPPPTMKSLAPFSQSPPYRCQGATALFPPPKLSVLQAEQAQFPQFLLMGKCCSPLTSLTMMTYEKVGPFVSVD